MAERFVTSGATLYQWIVLRHLADLSSIFPKHLMDYFMEGGWVSTLKDGQMVSLARDEFHERTASTNIQLIMPRNQTKKNMEVVAHYLSNRQCSNQNHVVRKHNWQNVFGTISFKGLW